MAAGPLADDRISILVVDDEEVLRCLLSDVVSEMGYAVEVAAGGDEALGMIARGRFEIIITDLKMPGMSGMELVRKARSIIPTLSVIVMTGYPSLETALEALREGAHDYITKPFHLESVKKSVGRAADTQTLRKKRESLRELGILDSLTQSFNKRYFQAVLPREIHRAKRHQRELSLLMVGIDDFERLSDDHGQLIGDQVLRRIAGLIISTVRNIDLVFRNGGAEFAILLVEAGKKDAAAIAGRLQKLVEEATIGPEILGVPSVTASVGVASYPEDARSGAELMSKADRALSDAKRMGRKGISLP